MLIVKKQANEFLCRFHHSSNLSYFSFINELQRVISVYKNTAYKLQFYEELIRVYNERYQRHKLHCTAQSTASCRFIKYYESTLFFLDEEIKYLLKKNTKNRISLKEKKKLVQLIDSLTNHIYNNSHYSNSIKDDLIQELNSLKELQLPNLSSYKQLVYGKLFGFLYEYNINKIELDLIKAKTDDLFSGLHALTKH